MKLAAFLSGRLVQSGGNFTPGYQTPAKAYGADLVLEIDGVKRQDAN
ncbi:MAG: hypothetical protein WBD27_02255 [Pyrinomonadaceae bacterium]